MPFDSRMMLLNEGFDPIRSLSGPTLTPAIPPEYLSTLLQQPQTQLRPIEQIRDEGALTPDLYMSPRQDNNWTLPAPIDQNTPLSPVVEPPAPAPATKDNPLTQPVVEGPGFLPAPAPPAAPAATPAAPAPLTAEQLRSQFLNQAMQGFGYNYGRNLIPDNSLDATINSILGEQKGQAQTYLDRGKARGIYNDVGYGAGQNKINTLAQGAQSQLSSLGTDVLNKYREQANKVRDDAFSAISGLLPGQNFSLDPYFGEGNAIRDTAFKNEAGDLRNALGGQNFFDFQGLTNAAGTAQGAQNLRDMDVAAAIGERNKRASFGRGLGSQGAF